MAALIKTYNEDDRDTSFSLKMVGNDDDDDDHHHHFVGFFCVSVCVSSFLFLHIPFMNTNNNPAF